MFATAQLVGRVRGVRTLNGGVPVYRNAVVRIRRLHPARVRPSSLYVLDDNLARLRGLALELEARGMDLFRLNTTVVVDGRAISPPLVEWDPEYRVPIIVDGIHRFWLAMKQGKRVSAVYVHGSDPRYPVIGLPVLWSEVRCLNALPMDPHMRRRLRPGIEDTSESLRRYYRDLSFMGSGGRRPSGNQRT